MPRKLTAQDLDAFRTLLRRIRAEITGDIQNLEADAFGVEGGKAGVDVTFDDGSDAYLQDFNLELLERDETTLREIDAALDRIEEGTFGTCEACQGGIGKVRLRALPYCRNCIDCQRGLEQAG